MKSFRHFAWVLIALLGVGGYAPAFADDLVGLTADMRPVEGTGYRGRGNVRYFGTGGGGVQASLVHNQRYGIVPPNADLGMDTVEGAMAADVELVLSDESFNPYARCQLSFGQIAISPAGVTHAVFRLAVRINRNGRLVGGPCVADMSLDPEDARPQDEIFPEVHEGDNACGVVMVDDDPIRALTGVLEE
ncbi:MAG: hypothetical protein U9Q81_22280 [Pseudomonadota bacterium]|nr:hypothetical protein [Pseudomonadota bacterium]